MKRITIMLTTTLLAAVLLAGGAGMAAAEPQKNQVLVPASCGANGEQQYTFVLNAQGNAGQIVGSNSNILIKSYVATYTKLLTGETFVDIYNSGNKTGQRDALISCRGETTYVDNVFGEVKVVFVFDGFVTPRGKG